MARALIVLCVLLAPSLAVAEPTQVGMWFGPRIFSKDSGLGYIDDAPAHPTLHNGIELGARVARQFFPFEWLIPEFEIAISPTSTTEVGGASSASIFWFEPRVQLRFELLPRRKIQPFIIVGGGSPIALSSARMTFNTGVSGDGYVGGGVRFDTQKG